MINKIIYRYIAWQSLKAIIITFLIISSIIILVDFVESARNLDSESAISGFQLLYLTFLRAPQLIQQTLPFISLFGVMGALHAMNRRSELTVMRASGLSVWRFILPILGLTMTLGLIWTAFINPLTGQLATHHNALSQKWDISDYKHRDRAIWLRSGEDAINIVITAKNINADINTLTQASFFILQVEDDKTTKLLRRYDVNSARLDPKGFWALNQATEYAARKKPIIHKSLSLPTTMRVEALKKYNQSAIITTFWQLPKSIAINQAAGYSTQSLRMEFHKLAALALTLMAMAFIAAAASLHLSRQGGTFKLLTLGACIGFIFYFLDNVISAFGNSGDIPVILACWAVPSVTLFLGINYLTFLEDG